MLKFENGKYHIEDDCIENKQEKTIDEDELIEKEINNVRSNTKKENIVGKILDFVSDSLINLIESKGYGDRNTYFVMGQKNGKVWDRSSIEYNGEYNPWGDETSMPKTAGSGQGNQHKSQNSGISVR